MRPSAASSLVRGFARTADSTVRPNVELTNVNAAEIMQDFRTLQHRIAQIRATPTAEEFYGQGYVLLRECAAEGQAVLERPFDPSPRAESDDPELAKAELKMFVNS